MFNFNLYNLKKYNYLLIINIILLNIISIYLVSLNSTPRGTLKYILGIIAGLIIMIVCSFIDYNFFIEIRWILYIINLILLLLVRFSPLGKSQFNVKRWLDLKVFDLQPSELTKIFLIIFLAGLFYEYKDKMDKFSTLLKSFILMFIPTFFILIQTNLSITIVIIIIFSLMIFAAGLKYKIIIPVLLILIPCFSFIIWYVQQPNQKLLKEYQQDRIVSIINPSLYPELMMQQNNSVNAISSGEIFGKFNNSTSDYRLYNNVPVNKSDFIYAVFGEEFGLIGSIVLILLLFLLVFNCSYIAYISKDYKAMLIAIGISIMFSIQIFVNIGVATSILPNTGLTLPFVSYGLSSLMANMISSGIILNIGIHNKNIE